MKLEDIKNITHTHYRKLKKHSKEVADNFDVEAIHQFRVTYKKLRAFLRMLSQKDGTSSEIKVPKKLKKIYTISGYIRDLQLQQQRIVETTKENRDKPKAYLMLLQQKINALKPELLEIFSEKPIHESKMKTDASPPGEFSPGDFQNFVEQKWASVYAIIKAGYFSDDDLHAIRKKLKDLLYILAIYKGAGNDLMLLDIWQGKDEAYFNKLLAELGKLQDKRTAIDLLKTFWLNSLPKYNRDLLQEIKKIWIKEKLLEKNLLVTKLTTGFPPQQALPN
ncbi:MAG: CHAD domain-containing protein [Ginsengibacter sp.]